MGVTQTGEAYLGKCDFSLIKHIRVVGEREASRPEEGQGLLIDALVNN